MEPSKSSIKDALKRAYDFFGFSEFQRLTPDQVDKVKSFIWKEKASRDIGLKRKANEFSAVSFETAKAKQSSQTPPEELLMLTMITRSSLIGAFKQQYQIGPYTADFAFPEIKAVVEVDGRDFHTEPAQIERDQRRDSYLTSLGWTVFRFPASEVVRSPNQLVDKIEKMVIKMCAMKNKKEAWEK